MTALSGMRKRGRRRVLVRAVAALALAGVVVGVLLAGPLRPQWRAWRGAMDLKRAQAAADRGQWAEARLLAQGALRRNGASPEAWQFLARVLHELKDPAELPARLRAWDVGGTDSAAAAEIFALAGNVAKGSPVAQEVLTRLPGLVERHGTNAALLCEAGLFTARHSNGVEGVNLVRRAVELAPGETRYQVALSSLQVGSTRPAVRTGAQEKLRELRSDTESGDDASRALARSLMRRSPEAAAKIWAEERARTNDWRVAMGWLDSQMKLGTNTGLAAVQEVFAEATNAVQWFAVLQRAAALGPDTLQQLVDRLPAGEASSTPVLQVKVRTLVEAGRYREALEQAEAALSRNDLRPDALTFLRTMQVRCCDRLGDGEQKRASLRFATESGADHATSGLTAGDQFMIWQMPAEARQMFEAVAARGGPAAERARARLALLEVQTPRMRAAALLEEGRCAEASALVREQLQRSDLAPDLRAVLAGIDVLCHHELKQPAQLEAAGAWVAGQAETAPTTVLEIGRDLLKKGMTNVATSVLSAVAMTSHRASAEAARDLIGLAESARDGAAMKRWAERVLLVEPRDRNAQHLTALVSLLQGADTNAIAVATQLHQRASNDVLFTGTYVLALWRSGRNDEALAALNALPPGQRRLPAMRLRRGLVLESLGRTNDAQRVVQGIRPETLLNEAVPLLERLQPGPTP